MKGIKYIEREDIDTGRWDGVIARSKAENLYAYSWYLDAVAERWSALVLEDYRFLMPLVWKRKIGLRYIYQPFYTQQLGVFSREYVDPTVISSMLSFIPRRFRFGTMQFNRQNMVPEFPPYTVTDRHNYVVDLQAGYERLSNAYSTNTRRNLRKSEEPDGALEGGIGCRDLVAFKRRHDAIARKESQYRWMERLLETIMANDRGEILATSSGGEIESAAFFGFSKTRAFYLVSVSSETGKANRGMFRIVDSFIRNHAGSPLKLDFEGSDIPSLARFFKGFGALPEIYQRVEFSGLPGWLDKIRGHV